MSFSRALMWPLSLSYGAITHLRARAYTAGFLHQRRLPGTVISVGNLTVGGTGKTPMVLWIVERLLREGKRVAILTRGYRGTESASGPTSPAAESTSDEVQLLKARIGPQAVLGVGPNRFKNGLELAEQGVGWFVLDDGFQHLQLARDVDIVLIDGTNPFGGGRLLPAGRLREPRTALSRADIIVITRTDHAPAVEAAIQRDSDAPIFYARPRLVAIRVLRKDYPGEENPDARSKKFFAFCGIGNPDAFVADLRAWGFHVGGQKFFPDHHRYTPADIEEIEREALDAKADAVICTEKDIFNLGGTSRDSLEIHYCQISTQVSKEDEFWAAIVSKAEARTGTN